MTKEVSPLNGSIIPESVTPEWFYQGSTVLKSIWIPDKRFREWQKRGSFLNGSIRGLQYLKHLDSRLLISGMTEEWIPDWKFREWQTWGNLTLTILPLSCALRDLWPSQRPPDGLSFFLTLTTRIMYKDLWCFSSIAMCCKIFYSIIFAFCKKGWIHNLLCR